MKRWLVALIGLICLTSWRPVSAVAEAPVAAAPNLATAPNLAVTPESAVLCQKYRLGREVMVILHLGRPPQADEVVKIDEKARAWLWTAGRDRYLVLPIIDGSDASEVVAMTRQRLAARLEELLLATPLKILEEDHRRRLEWFDQLTEHCRFHSVTVGDLVLVSGEMMWDTQSSINTLPEGQRDLATTYYELAVAELLRAVMAVSCQ